MAKQPTSDGKIPAGYWFVKDQNARELDAAGAVIPRLHEPVLGVRYALSFEKATAMPEAHARVFLKDPAFIVTNADGEPVAPLNPDAMTRVMPNRLKPGTVIATLEELTHDALLTRAAQLPDCPKFNANSRREMIIDFIQTAMDGGARLPTGRGAADPALLQGPDADAAPVDVDDMDDDDAASILKGQ